MKNIAAFIILLFVSAALYAQEIKPISLNTLKQRFEKGKDTIYVINFWATWCAPCIQEMPYFENLQQNYKSQPLKVIFLSMDFKSQLESRVKPLIKKMSIRNESFLAEKKNDQEFIEQVSKDWEGAIPGTLFVNLNKHLWKFFQREFTYEELEKTYQSLK